MVDCRVPTLADIAPLGNDSIFQGLTVDQGRQLLHDESEQTALEHGDGIIPAVRFKCGRSRACHAETAVGYVR